MNGFRRLLIVALGVFGLSTASFAAEPCAKVDQPRQLESLQFIYYRGGEAPPNASAAEIDELRRLKALPELSEQAAFLETAFPGNENLQAIAIRDRDGDGIKDYRITPCGEFRENDPDVDCDGVPNVLDNSPYDNAVAPGSPSCAREPDWGRITNDHNANGIPDQIDWRLLDAASSEEKRAAAIQEGLYRDYRIVLVDRRTRMSAAMVTELDHVIREIFYDRVTPGFPPLRVIATDIPACPSENDSSGWADDYGWTSPENSTVLLTPDTLALSRILRLEILVHEITHTLQYALDFSPQDLQGFRTRNRFDSDGFHKLAGSLGWVIVPDPSQAPRPAYRLAVRDCDEYDYPFTLTYGGKSGEEWQADWKTFRKDSNLPQFEDPKLKANHMVSDYGFTDAWEWDAEVSAALVLNQLLAAAGRICNPDEAAALGEQLHADIEKEKWEYVNENAIGLDAYEKIIAPQFHVTDDSWDALARFFLVASYPGDCKA